jgi:uncharacterized membrane protein (Fun14 family)
MPNLNITVSKTLHIILYLVCVAITAVLYLASKGNITLTSSVAGVLSLVLTAINSVDPATVLAKASPAVVEEAAKKLPPEALGRLVEYQRIKAV